MKYIKQHKRLATVGLQIMLCAICIFSAFFSSMHSKDIVAFDNVSSEEEYQEILKGQVREVVLTQLNNPETNKPLVDAVSSNLVEKLEDTGVVTVKNEEELKKEVATILADSDMANAIADSVSNKVVKKTGSDIANIDLSQYATKDLVAEVERNLKSASDSATDKAYAKLSQDDVDKIKDFVNHGNTATVSEKDVQNIVEKKLADGRIDAALKNYKYEFTDEEKTAIANAVSNQVTGNLSSMASEVESLKTRMAALETQISTNGTVSAEQITELQNQITNNNTASAEAISNLQGEVNSLKEKATATETAINSCAKASEVNASLSALNESVSALEGSVSDLNSLKGRTETAEGNITTLEGEVTEIQGNVTTLTNTTASLQTQITDNANAVSELQGDVTDLQTKTQSALDQLSGLNDTYSTDAEVNAVKTELEGQINTLTTAVGSVNDKVTALESEIATTYATKSEITNAVNNINSSISGLNETYATDEEVTTAISGVNSTISTLQGQTNDIESDLSELSTAVNTYKDTVANTYATIQALNTALGRITGVESDVASLQNDVSNLTTGTVKVADYDAWKEAAEGRISALETKVSTMKTLLGETDISIYNDGTVTGAISGIEKSLNGYTFKIVSESEYKALVESGKADENTIYLIR